MFVQLSTGSSIFRYASLQFSLPQELQRPQVSLPAETPAPPVRTSPAPTEERAQGIGESAEHVRGVPRHDHADDGHSSRKQLKKAVHRLEKAVAGRIREAMREADFDPAARQRVSSLLKEFHHDLKAVVHDASEKHGLDPAALRDGIAGAVRDLTAGLHALLDELGVPAADGTTAQQSGGSGQLPDTTPDVVSLPDKPRRQPVVSLEFALQIVLSGRIEVYA